MPESATGTAERYLPLYEAKMIHHYDHRWATYDGTVTRDVTDAEKADPEFLALPRYWVAEANVSAQTVGWDHGWLLGWRRNARNTDLRTMIAGVISAAAGDSLFLALPEGALTVVGPLVAVFGSFVLDFVARQKVGGINMSFYFAEQFPVLTPESLGGVIADFINPRVLEITYTATDLEGFAADVGFDGPPFQWVNARRALIRAELDAMMFRIYGIERADVEYIMETFPVVRRRDEDRFREYRTKRLILERFDALVAAEIADVPYETPLDPPPGVAGGGGSSIRSHRSGIITGSCCRYPRLRDRL